MGSTIDHEAKLVRIYGAKALKDMYQAATPRRPKSSKTMVEESIVHSTERVRSDYVFGIRAFGSACTRKDRTAVVRHEHGRAHQLRPRGRGGRRQLGVAARARGGGKWQPAASRLGRLGRAWGLL